ncbi:helix-turn-helix domain-containing protein [Clostridiaceae bacterium HSG29]|nr:helix-turn-helix domain-containing protein [Clostridiaceae bacterium HSG29]
MRKYKDKEILIFNTTWELFSERGFHDIKISEIAKLSGIGKGTVYEYFNSKEELVQEMTIYNLEMAHEKIISEIEIIDSPVEKLRVIGQNDINRKMDILKTLKIVQMITDFSKNNIKKSVFENIGKRFILVQEIIEEGIRKGVINTESSINATILYTGTMNNALMIDNFTDGNAINMNEILEYVIGILIKKS